MKLNLLQESRTLKISAYFFLFGLILCLLGGNLNWHIMKINHGLMPVFSNSIIDDGKHFAYQDYSLVNSFAFTDIIRMRTGNQITVFSIGDLLVYSGCLFIWISSIFLSYSILKMSVDSHGVRISSKYLKEIKENV